MLNREKATGLLRHAADLVSGPRAQTHDPEGRQMDVAAKMITAFLGVHVTASDVCFIMAIMKVSRAKVGDSAHEDHYTDAAAYAAMAGAMGSKYWCCGEMEGTPHKPDCPVTGAKAQAEHGATEYMKQKLARKPETHCAECGSVGQHRNTCSQAGKHYPGPGTATQKPEGFDPRSGIDQDLFAAVPLRHPARTCNVCGVVEGFTHAPNCTGRFT